jgi:predicted ATPase
MNEHAASPTTRTHCPILVGRSGPIATLRAAALGGADSPCVVLVGGEAGIGKSRLAAEAATTARAHAQPVLAAGCHSGASIPYEPFVALLRKALRRRDRVETRELFRGTARLAATLLPEMEPSTRPATSGAALLAGLRPAVSSCVGQRLRQWWSRSASCR